MADKKPTENKAPKKQGPIRTGAIIPTILILALIYAYTYFFFDNHLRRALEWGGYMAYGGEINIDNITTSFWDAKLRIDRIQMTDLDQPKNNALEIKQIRSDLLWDALLRGKVAITEAAIEGIQVGTPRKRPGRIKPPQPDAGPGLISREAQKIKAKAIAAAQEQYNENILGDFAKVINGGVSVNDQLQNIKQDLKGVVKTEELQKVLKEKEVQWKQRISELPTAKDLKVLEERLKNVQTSNFKNPAQLQSSLKEVDAVFKDLEAKRNFIDQTGKGINTDLSSFQNEIKLIEKYIKEDIENLEDRLKIPKLDASAISKGLFTGYLTPILAKVDEYKALADRWMPPNLKAGGKKDTETVVQAHPRIEGTTYTFGRPNSYPMFWLKKAIISSEAQNSPFGGDVRGELIDATTNQYALGRPTKLLFNGNFPAKNIAGVEGDFILDLRKGPKAQFKLGVGSYPVGTKKLSDSKDVKLAFADALGKMDLRGAYNEEQGFKFRIDNAFSSLKWQIEAQQKEVQEIVTRVLNDIPEVTLQASGGGKFPKINFNVKSNLGPELVKGFHTVLAAKLKEAQAKIEQEVRARIEAEKAKLMTEYQKVKSQAEAEITKVKKQVDDLKAQAEAEKKKAENQAKAEVDKEKKKANDALKKEGKKAVDKLKKGFGL